MLEVGAEYSSTSEYFEDFNMSSSSTSTLLLPSEGSTRKKCKNIRRFSDDQIRSLEVTFEHETKLEPRKKVQLAKELGLQPRQVAIWFQNKRARWKSKQIEKDYSVLLSSYNHLASQFKSLKKENKSLIIQLQKLKKNNNLNEMEGNYNSHENCKVIMNQEIGGGNSSTDEESADCKNIVANDQVEEPAGMLSISDDDHISSIKSSTDDDHLHHHLLGFDVINHDDDELLIMKMGAAGDHSSLTSADQADWEGLHDPDELIINQAPPNDGPNNCQWWDFWS